MSYVDLAPITHPDLVPVAAARALGLPDQPGRSTTETVVRVHRRPPAARGVGQLRTPAGPVAALIDTLLAECPALTMLATSREPIGVASEATWRVPSLSLDGEAIDLFADRARKVRPEFSVTDDNSPR